MTRSYDSAVTEVIDYGYIIRDASVGPAKPSGEDLGEGSFAYDSYGHWDYVSPLVTQMGGGGDRSLEARGLAPNSALEIASTGLAAALPHISRGE